MCFHNMLYIQQQENFELGNLQDFFFLFFPLFKREKIVPCIIFAKSVFHKYPHNLEWINVEYALTELIFYLFIFNFSFRCKDNS